MAVSQKTGNKPTSRLSNTTLGYIPKYAQSHYKDICSTMFTAAFSAIAGTWEKTKCPSAKEWIKKMWYIYTMKYYLVIKNNDILKFACKWMELESIILSGKSKYGNDTTAPS